MAHWHPEREPAAKPSQQLIVNLALTSGEEKKSVDLSRFGDAFAGCTVQARRLRGGYSEGVDVVRIATPRLSMDVLPTRGMGIWKAEVDGITLGWSSPVRGPVHPMWVDLADPSGLGWLMGFDEFLVRCGLSSNGAPEFDRSSRLKYPLHGRIANLPAHDLHLEVSIDRGEFALKATVDEGRFGAPLLRLEPCLTVRPGDAGFAITDTIANPSSVAAESQLLYHINLGRPLLGRGSRLVAPIAEVVPRDKPSAAAIDTWPECESPGNYTGERAYFCRLGADTAGKTRVLFRDPTGMNGLELRFDVAQLPFFTYWKNLVDEADGYVVGLEPATNYPNPKSFEVSNHRLIALEPGIRLVFELAIDVLRGSSNVAKAEKSIAALSAATPPKVHLNPSPDFCYDSSGEAGGDK